MEFEDFFDVVDGRPRSLVVVNRRMADPLQRMLEKAMDGQPVAVEERDMPDADKDVVALIEDREGGQEVVATSPLEALNDTILMVNSDLYKTGGVEFGSLELPDVLEGLHDVPFRLRGYPESNTEKLLLIVISRYIEQRAAAAGCGTLRSSFQRLSRLEDERGTREVYEFLSASPVETHAYGVPDIEPLSDTDLHTHGGYTDDYRDSWFVVYTPPEGGLGGSEPGHIALLALETDPRIWRSFWTFEPSLVERIDRYVRENL